MSFRSLSACRTQSRVIEYVPGWKCDISKARTWEDLPEAARNYVEYVEKAIGCHIGFVSVGAERDSLIIR